MNTAEQLAAGTVTARRVLCVIPARGGSKGIPGKNLAIVGGRSLLGRAVEAALAARLVDEVVVSTDDDVITAAARALGAGVVRRPAELSGDLATSESAVLHAVHEVEMRSGSAVDVAVLVQCTSPFVTAADIDGVAGAVLNGADCALTASPTHGFLWRVSIEATKERGAERVDGQRVSIEATKEPVVQRPERVGDQPATVGVNHDPMTRPRRQDRPQELLETGAAYAMNVDGLRRHGHRFFGRIEVVAVDPARTLEVDEPADLARARLLAPLLDAPSEAASTGRPASADVDAVVLDFDGTQTDDRVVIDQDGRETVTVHRGDGLGVAALRRAGIGVLILSAERNGVVSARARKLGVPVRHGVEAKGPALAQWCTEQGHALDRTVYLGNDVNDLPCFDLVGWPVAVADAHDAVRARARVVTTATGGNGAVREVASWLLGEELDHGSQSPTLHR